MSARQSEGNESGGDDRRSREVAAALMRMALALLDRADEGLAAARLQHALDTLEQRRAGRPTDANLDALGPPLRHAE